MVKKTDFEGSKAKGRGTQEEASSKANWNDRVSNQETPSEGRREGSESPQEAQEASDDWLMEWVGGQQEFRLMWSFVTSVTEWMATPITKREEGKTEGRRVTTIKELVHPCTHLGRNVAVGPPLHSGCSLELPEPAWGESRWDSPACGLSGEIWSHRVKGIASLVLCPYTCCTTQRSQ